MAARYAERTKVNSEQTRVEIERLLTRYGAISFSYGWDQETAIVAFRLKDRLIRFRLPMPDRQSREFTHTPERGLKRTQDAMHDAYEQAVRQRWRALLIIIKAKLEAVAAGVVSLEDEFLAQTMLSSGETVGEFVGPQIEETYRTGGMPSLLPGVQHKALPSGDIERRP